MKKIIVKDVFVNKISKKFSVFASLTLLKTFNEENIKSRDILRNAFK